MLSYQKGVVKTSVRHLVEFLFRGGDITTGSSVSASPEAMLEGSRLHRKIQRGQKATYQSEVPLKMEWQEEGYDLVLEGRADGIDKTEVNKDRLSDVDGMNQTESDEEKLQHVIGMNQISPYAVMLSDFILYSVSIWLTPVQLSFTFPLIQYSI